MSTIPASFNKVTIHLEALHSNFAHLREKAGRAAFLAMVKADGYGHGMIECSQTLERQGCKFFGVAELGEAVLLRKEGNSSTIFALIGFEKSEAEAFCEYDIVPVVYDIASLEALSRAAVKSGKKISVHVKVDTGMCRLGVDSKGLGELLSSIEKLPGLVLGGLASHFPSSDDPSSSTTAECLRRFKACSNLVPPDSFPLLHIANSGGTLNSPQSRCDLVRCGISLYGYYPDGGIVENSGKLRPVMSFATQVLQVKKVPTGCGVSYGHTYITRRPTILAVLPVGYEDGYSRQLSNRGEVLIRGKRAKIRGRVCMNLCMVDVTDIEGVQPGDEAVLLGSQGEETITADELARKQGTISYEVLCMIGNNNDREFK